MSNTTVDRIIDDFYSHPVKTGADGSEFNIQYTSLRREEVEAIKSLIEIFRPAKTLEVGLALGSSAVAIAAARQRLGINDPHIVLDPFQESGVKNAGLLEIKRLGLERSVVHYPLFSENFLNQCSLDGTKFDFVFVDGNHNIGQAVTDVFLANKVLNPGGIIAVHDSLLFSTAASIKHLIIERQFKLVFPIRYTTKGILRMIKYGPKLGSRYVREVVPRMVTSLVALQKG